MRIAHLIIAHKEPAQVARLVKMLAHDACDIFIHVDKKSDQAAYSDLALTGPVRFIRNRQSVRWASYSFTKAILSGMREILAWGEYDFINLLSGQDYPLQPAACLVELLNQNPETNFLKYEADGSPWWQENRNRVEQYHSTDFHFKGQYQVQSWVNRILPSRKFPLSYTLYGGNCAMYWTLTGACARYVLDFIDRHPALKRFARYTWAPDEFLIPTIIMNSAFRTKVKNDNLRYIDWSQGGANPKFLTICDLDKLAASGCFFARKFDIRQDSLLLDKLDECMTNHYQDQFHYIHSELDTTSR